MLQAGDIVDTPQGIGQVVYVRMAGPDYAQVQAVSVGTMFSADKVSIWTQNVNIDSQEGQ